MAKHRNCCSFLQTNKKTVITEKMPNLAGSVSPRRLLFELHEHKNSLYLCRSVICLTCSSTGGSLCCTQPHVCTCAQAETCMCRMQPHQNISYSSFFFHATLCDFETSSSSMRGNEFLPCVHVFFYLCERRPPSRSPQWRGGSGLFLGHLKVLLCLPRSIIYV